MKMNKTYPLKEMLEALSNASDNVQSCAERLKQSGLHECDFVHYETEGILTTSLYARVTLTNMEGETRWTGYMETGANNDMWKIPVAVVKVTDTLKANDDYTKFEIIVK